MPPTTKPLDERYKPLISAPTSNSESILKCAPPRCTFGASNSKHHVSRVDGEWRCRRRTRELDYWYKFIRCGSSVTSGPRGEGPGHSGRSGVGIIQAPPRIAHGYTPSNFK